MAAICLLPLRLPSEFIFDSDSAALMCTPVPLCMYMCTWFQVLVQVCTTCRHVSMAAILFFYLYAVFNFIDQIRSLYRVCRERGSYQIFSSWAFI